MEEKFTGIVEGFTIEGNAWLHRNNHNEGTAWKVLGFDDKDKFTDPLGMGEYYISVGCLSRKLTVDSYERIARLPDENENEVNEKWNEFEKTCFEELYNREKPKYRYSLWRFLFEFEQGDILLVPGKHKDFHVFRIISEKPVIRDEIKDKYPAEFFVDEHDFHYFWKVEPVRVNIERRKLADQSLSSRLKFRGTTSWLNEKLKKSLITAVRSEKLSLNEAAQESLCQPFLKAINDKTNDYKFEELIKWYFQRIGASFAKVLSKKKESSKNEKGIQDADVEATFEALRVKVYVQAKKHDKKVDLENALAQITEYRKENEEAGYTCLYWVIYSSPDESFAEEYDIEKYEDIRVISGIEFASMLLNAGIEGIDEAFYGKDSTEKKDTEK